MEISDLQEYISGMFKEFNIKIDSKFNDMNSEFTRVNNGFINVNNKIDNLSLDLRNDILNVNTKIDTLENKIDIVNATINQRIDILSDHVDNSLVVIRGQVESKVALLNNKIDLNKKDNDAQIANIFNEISVINTINNTSGEDLSTRINSQIKPEYKSIKETQSDIIDKVNTLSNILTDLSNRPVVSSENFDWLCGRVGDDIGDLREQHNSTHRYVEQVCDNIQTFEKNLTSISDKVDKSIGAWVLDNDMGEETRKGFSLSLDVDETVSGKKDSKKSSRKSKEVNVFDDDDPDDSDGSSPSDKSDDDQNKRDIPKKKDMNPKRAKFKAPKRRESIIGNDDDSDTEGIGFGHRQPAIICVQPPLTTDKLYLEEVKINNVLAFCRKFNEEDSKYVGGLKTSNYIKHGVLSQMKQVAAKHDLPGKDGILKAGKQRISNQDMFAIIAVMCAPSNLEKMQCELSKSAWPLTTHKHDYKDAEVILKNIKDFSNDLLVYINRFQDKLNLLGYHSESEKFLPKRLFKKGGSTGNPGIADYFIGGLPNLSFGQRVWSSVEEEKRSKCKKWKVFLKLYMEAIEEIEKREEDKDVNRQICIGVKEMVKSQQHIVMFDPKVISTNQLLNGSAQDMSNLGNDLDTDEEIMDNMDYSDMPSDIEVDKENLDFNNSNQDIPMGNTPPGTCFDMINTGKCSRVNCPFSHKEEDILKGRKLKADRNATKQVTFQKVSNLVTRKL